MLAQQFPTAPETAQTVLIILNVLVVILLLFKTLTKKDAAPIPQPMVTAKHPEYVPRQEFVKLENRVDSLGTRMESIHQDLLHAGEKRAADIHIRLNSLIESAANVQGKLTIIQEQIKPKPRA